MVESRVRDSLEYLKGGNARYFARTLPSAQTWRLFPEFRHSTAYLDVETSVGGGPENHITTIALWDGTSLYYYVHGYNLGKFAKDIARYKVIVTYNGKSFDVPVIEKFFNIRLDHAHIDLRHVLHSLGYRGGLKGCEKQLGLYREELEGVDGYLAVLLWRDYIDNGNPKALDTLLAYNILDAVNLEPLMVIAYNQKLRETPFVASHRLEDPIPPRNPFNADVRTIKRIKAAHPAYY